MARQCPRCELRFHDENEVRQHLIDDHGVDPEQVPVTGRPARGTVREGGEPPTGQRPPA